MDIPKIGKVTETHILPPRSSLERKRETANVTLASRPDYQGHAVDLRSIDGSSFEYCEKLPTRPWIAPHRELCFYDAVLILQCLAGLPQDSHILPDQTIDSLCRA